jgi:hypothetical protein
MATANIQGIYVALFGRPADPQGLVYFNGVTREGADLTAIADLANTAEYRERFAGQSNEQVVRSIYLNLFEREGESAGVNFFVQELNSGRLNINNIAIAILNGAQNEDLTTVNAKIAAANLFTQQLDTPDEQKAYVGNSAAAVGREYLADVASDNLASPQDADTAISHLSSGQGQGQADVYTFAQGDSYAYNGPNAGPGSAPTNGPIKYQTIENWDDGLDKIRIAGFSASSSDFSAFDTDQFDIHTEQQYIDALELQNGSNFISRGLIGVAHLEGEHIYSDRFQPKPNLSECAPDCREPEPCQ